MKRFMKIIVLLLITTVSNAQNNITLTNQLQIDSFRVNHPNLEIIDGTLKILEDSYSPYDIVSLDSLIGIKRITGDLVIDTYYDLTSVNGLDSLTFVGGSLQLIDGVINNISALHNLDSVMGNFETHYLSLFYDELDNLKYIGEALIIEHNNKSVITGFESLYHIGALNLWDNPYLTDISFIENIEINSATGNTYIQIVQNSSLTECSFSPVCEKLNMKFFPVLIMDNANGCDSRFEILNNCYNREQK